MASFPTHFAAGITTSGVAATTLLAAGVATPSQMLGCLAAGSLGSVLPDLDAQDSAPRQVVRVAVSLAAAFVTMFALAPMLGSVLEHLAVWIGAYVLARLAAFGLFRLLTVHRGLLHSLPAAPLAGLVAAVLADRLLGWPAVECWLWGGFVTLGYVLHLIVDEAVSLNPFGLRTRRSLGSALSLWSSRAPLASVGVYAMCAVAFLAAPSVEPVVRLVADATPGGAAQVRLLPDEGRLRDLLSLTQRSKLATLPILER